MRGVWNVRRQGTRLANYAISVYTSVDGVRMGRRQERRQSTFSRIRLAYAAGIFLGPTLEATDGRHDYGELRIRAIGAVDGEVLLVVFTDRGEIRRIISARRANRKERLKWQSFASR